MQKLEPCLWFDKNAEEAAKYYTSLFPNSSYKVSAKYSAESAKAAGMQEGAVMAIYLKLAGQDFVALNGGPIFKPTPALSMFIACNTEEEINELYAKLKEGGSVLMELQEYPFAKRYAWVADRWGHSWQMIFGVEARSQKITPAILMCGKNAGKAEEAIKFYTSVFSNSSVDFMHKYQAGDGQPEGSVAHAIFTVDGYQLIAMDSHADHAFDFSMATSITVRCENQQEVDKFWTALQADGGAPSQCGWLTDKFGVAWQIVPKQLEEIMTSDDQERKTRAHNALLKMTKLNVAELQNA